MYLYSLLAEFLIRNRVKHKGFYDILNTQTDFKHNNDIYECIYFRRHNT